MKSLRLMVMKPQGVQSCVTQAFRNNVNALLLDRNHYPSNQRNVGTMRCSLNMDVRFLEHLKRKNRA